MFEETVEFEGEKKARFAYAENQVESPISGQLAAYNDHNVDEFCKFYSETVEIYKHGETVPFIKGIAAFRETYSKLFSVNSKLNAVVDRRLVLGNTVIDEEIVSGHPRGDFVKVIAIYEVTDSLITKAWFVT